MKDVAYLVQGIGFLILLGAGWYLFSPQPSPHAEPTPLEQIEDTGTIEPMPLTLSSPVFEHGERIPRVFTCDGENVSPPLSIDGVPEGAVSLALTMEDPDVPTSIREDGMWDHWVLYNIPPATRVLGQGESVGVSGVTTGGKLPYTGPCPPDREHRYFFKLFALDIRLDLPAGATKQELLQRIEGHVLAEAELMGTYARANNE